MVTTIQPGDRFGKLTVIRRDTERPDSWICACDCGDGEGPRYSCDLRKGRSRQCLKCRLAGGENSARWTGGRHIMANGYIQRVRGGRREYEHRIVAAEMLGRPLRRDEQVHHIDGNKQNNDPSNLKIVSRAEHALEHRRSGKRLRMPGEPNEVVACVCGCGGTFEMFDRSGRYRRMLPGHTRRAERATSSLLPSTRGLAPGEG